LFALAEELKGMVYAFTLFGKKTADGFDSLISGQPEAAATTSRDRTADVKNLVSSDGMSDNPEDLIPFDESMLK
jgi:hypothetical protein